MIKWTYKQIKLFRWKYIFYIGCIIVYTLISLLTPIIGKYIILRQQSWQYLLNMHFLFIPGHRNGSVGGQRSGSTKTKAKMSIISHNVIYRSGLSRKSFFFLLEKQNNRTICLGNFLFLLREMSKLNIKN